MRDVKPANCNAIPFSAVPLDASAYTLRARLAARAQAAGIPHARAEETGSTVRVECGTARAVVLALLLLSERGLTVVSDGPTALRVAPKGGMVVEMDEWTERMAA